MTLALTIVSRGFGLSNQLSIEVVFSFSNKGLKSQDFKFRMKKKNIYFLIIVYDIKFGLGIFTTHFTYIFLKCLFHIETALVELALHNAYSFFVVFYVVKTFKAYVCPICCKYVKTKSRIIKR